MDREDKPKWLLELENRKQKPRLAHETGAGAHCLICDSACPGLDLHFWRKICKNCKCRGDDHDINDDDFPQFELLFEFNIKNKKNCSFLLQVNDKKQLPCETSFEWIPPNTTKQLAVDYMKALPFEKLPIKGSTGAILRRQQVKKQLPLHDIDYKACDALDEQAKREFEKYLFKLKNCAGQGKVIKFSSIQTFDQSLMTPVNVTDVQQFSLQHQQLLNLSKVLNLRTPSSFIQRMPQISLQINLPSISNNANASLVSNIEVIQALDLPTNDEVQSQLGCYHDTLANISNNENLADPFGTLEAYNLGPNLITLNNYENYLLKMNETCEFKHSKNAISTVNEEYVQNDKVDKNSKAIINNLSAYSQKINSLSKENLEHSSELQSNTSLAEHILSKTHLPPSATNANDIVGSSLDEKELIYIRNKLIDKYSNENDYQNLLVIRELEQTRHCSLISNFEKIKQDVNKFEEFENKSINFSERIRNQLLPQPLYTTSEHLQTELNVSSCIQSNIIQSQILNNHIFPENTIGTLATFQNPENIGHLEKKMKDLTLNTSKLHKCHKCEKNIYCGNVAVTAEKIKDAVWHPGCFVCSACNELLVDLIYFIYEEKLYCGRDFAKLLEIPRCFACDELIFVREYTVAEGHNYHVKHFCCWDCDIPLAGQQYISENDRPLCLPCYQTNYAKTCNTCNSIIAADQQGVAIKSLNFHAIDNCFCCFTCKKSLLEGQIAIKENKPLCSKECIAKFSYKKP